MKAIIFGCITLLSFNSRAQIIRFNHKLSQSKINDAGFILCKTTLTELHSLKELKSNDNITLIPNIGDTVVTNDFEVTISGKDTFVISVSTNPLKSNEPLPGGNALTMIPGCLFRMAANTPIIIPAHSTAYIASGRPTYLSVSYKEPTPNSPSNKGLISTSTSTSTFLLHSTTSFTTETKTSPLPPQLYLPVLKSLATNTCQLISPTKGIISVSGGKIIFDPWQVTVFPTIPNGTLNPVDANTPVPLELKDGRSFIANPTKVLKVPYQHVTIGINTIPFRYRSRRIVADTVNTRGTATTSFNLAVSGGYTWGYSEITTRSKIDYSFTIGAFAGPSSTQLTAATVTNPTQFVPGTTNAVITYGINTIFTRNGYGILLALGADKALGFQGNKWIYNNQPWFGIGIAANFLN